MTTCSHGLPLESKCNQCVSEALDAESRREKRERPKRCKSCRKLFYPARPMQSVCSHECARKLAERARSKQEARVEREARKDTRARLEALKTLPELLAEAQKEFNAWVRFRDCDLPCICCGRYAKSAYLTGGEVDCGHYRGVGAAGHLRFNPDNAHGQLKQCNRRAFDSSAYRRNLIAKIGLERVEALENDNTPHKWTRDEVRGIRDKYRAMVREMKKGKA